MVFVVVWKVLSGSRASIAEILDPQGVVTSATTGIWMREGGAIDITTVVMYSTRKVFYAKI